MAKVAPLLSAPTIASTESEGCGVLSIETTSAQQTISEHLRHLFSFFDMSCTAEPPRIPLVVRHTQIHVQALSLSTSCTTTLWSPCVPHRALVDTAARRTKFLEDIDHTTYVDLPCRGSRRNDTIQARGGSNASYEKLNRELLVGDSEHLTFIQFSFLVVWTKGV